MKLKTTIKTMCLAACSGMLAISTANAQDNADFKPSGNLWGYMFGDYAVKAHNDTLGRGAGNVQYKTPQALNSGNTASAANPAPANSVSSAFQIRRVYLGYDYQFMPNFSANVVLAHEETGTGAGNQDLGGSNTMYLKYANVKWSNIFKNSDLVIGQYSTASFATPYGTEPLWGYRSIERTIMDLHNNDASSDMGVSLQGKAWVQGGQPDSLKPTFIGYIAQIGNGNSAKFETDNFKKMRLNLYVSTLQRKLTIGIYGDYNNNKLLPNYHVNTMTMKFYAAYTTDRFRVGAEVFTQTTAKGDIYSVYDPSTKTMSKNDTATGMQMGWSVFASASIIKEKLNIFARYDMYNPNTKWNTNNVYASTATASGLTATTQATAFYNQSFFTAGLDWTPNKRMHIMPNIWYNGYSTMMNTVGPDGTGNNLSARVKNDYDVAYRLSFYFLFNQNKKVSNNGMY